MVSCTSRTRSHCAMRSRVASIVRLQNFLRSDFVVVEKSISRFHFRPTIGGSGNAEIRSGAEFLHKFSEPIVEPFITQIRAANFVFQTGRTSILQLSHYAQNSIRGSERFDVSCRAAQ